MTSDHPDDYVPPPGDHDGRLDELTDEVREWREAEDGTAWRRAGDGL